MAQHQPGGDAILQHGKIGDVIEEAFACGFTFEHSIGRCTAQPLGLAADFSHLRFQCDGGELDEAIKLGAIQWLGDHQPADEVGRFDRGSGSEGKALVRGDDPARAARVEARP